MAFTEAVTILKDPTTGKEITIESACTDKKHLHEERPRNSARPHTESVSRRSSRESNKCRSDLSSIGTRSRSSRRSGRCNGRCDCENRCQTNGRCNCKNRCKTVETQCPADCCCCCCYRGAAPVVQTAPIAPQPLPAARFTPQVTSAIPNLSMQVPNVASVVSMAQPPAFAPPQIQLQQPIPIPPRPHQLVPIHRIKKGGYNVSRAVNPAPGVAMIAGGSMPLAGGMSYAGGMPFAGGMTLAAPYGVANTSTGFTQMPVPMAMGASTTTPVMSGQSGGTQMTLSIPGRGAIHIPCFLA